MNLNNAFNPAVYGAFIIRIKGNEISESLAARCGDSCYEIGQKFEYFDAVDGTGDSLKLPDNPILKLVKLTNTALTQTEAACFLSHFLLWVKCAELDQPIVILEHDAIMVRKYEVHPFFNVVNYLGSIEQHSGSFGFQFPMPPQGQLNENFRFMLRAHAYAIDPVMARGLISKVIKLGIYTSADIIFRIDEFAIIQDGFYAYDLSGPTTITNRELKPDSVPLTTMNYSIQGS